MDISNHVRTQWAMRGDHDVRVEEVWSNSVEVMLPDYSYSEARYSPEHGTAFLAKGGCVSTVLTVYDHMQMFPVEEIQCPACSRVFQGRKDCPTCGSVQWRQ